jgi:hypothetical protein
VTSILVKDLEYPVALGQEPRTLQHIHEHTLRVVMKMIGLPINQRKGTLESESPGGMTENVALFEVHRHRKLIHI